MKIKVKKHLSISILNLSFSEINKFIKIVNNNRDKIDSIHVDIMDGHFVKNISLGLNYFNYMSRKLKLPIDVHLMVTNPDIQYLNYLESNTIYFHFESLLYKEIRNLLSDIRLRNVRVGLTVNPKTKISQIYEYVSNCDEILIMTVYPGKGGQTFIKKMEKKIVKLAKYLNKNQLNTIITVDGGINEEIIKKYKNIGINKFVVGSCLTSKIVKLEDNLIKINKLLK